MSGFNSNQFENLFAPYLSKAEKGRLSKSLKQFKKDNTDEIDYNRFYSTAVTSKHFLQGDLLRQIRNSEWDVNSAQYVKKYPDSLILSNTCDIHGENLRDIPKDALFAPTVKLAVYLEALATTGLAEKKIKEIEATIKRQGYSNIFYLPPNHSDKNDYVVALDHLYWFPNEELKTYSEDISANRICSLHYFGQYLLLIKLSYHFCRLPEGDDRDVGLKESNWIKFVNTVKAIFN